VTFVQTLHDDWCRFLTTGGVCDCDPEIRIVSGPTDEPEESG